MAALTVNESALERLAAALHSASDSRPEGACFRMTLDDEGSLALAIDVPLSDDKTFQYEGETVLVMTNEFAERFAGRTLEANEAGDFVLV